MTSAALSYLDGEAHAIGPYMNVYNEDSLEFFAGNGARSICLPPEVPASAIALLGQKVGDLGVELEVQVYGRVPLALSARCYHARAHGRTKDSCLFVCEKDPDGMVLNTQEDVPFSHHQRQYRRNPTPASTLWANWMSFQHMA